MRYISWFYQNVTSTVILSLRSYLSCQFVGLHLKVGVMIEYRMFKRVIVSVIGMLSKKGGGGSEKVIKIPGRHTLMVSYPAKITS